MLARVAACAAWSRISPPGAPFSVIVITDPPAGPNAPGVRCMQASRGARRESAEITASPRTFLCRWWPGRCGPASAWLLGSPARAISRPMAVPLRVRPATADDVPVLLTFIRGLAEYERLTERFVAREENLRAHLFGPRPYCEALIGEDAAGPAGYALFFHGYSTFETRPTIWLEDLFVQPDRRRQGL